MTSLPKDLVKLGTYTTQKLELYQQKLTMAQKYLEKIKALVLEKKKKLDTKERNYQKAIQRDIDDAVKDAEIERINATTIYENALELLTKAKNQVDDATHNVALAKGQIELHKAMIDEFTRTGTVSETTQGLALYDSMDADKELEEEERRGMMEAKLKRKAQLWRHLEEARAAWIARAKARVGEQVGERRCAPNGKMLTKSEFWTGDGNYKGWNDAYVSPGEAGPPEQNPAILALPRPPGEAGPPSSRQHRYNLPRPLGEAGPPEQNPAILALPRPPGLSGPIPQGQRPRDIPSRSAIVAQSKSERTQQMLFQRGLRKKDRNRDADGLRRNMMHLAKTKKAMKLEHVTKFYNKLLKHQSKQRRRKNIRKTKRVGSLF